MVVQLGSLINFEEREVERMRWTNFVLKLACMLVLLLFGECSFYFRGACMLIIHYVLSCVLKPSIRCKLILFCVLKLKLLIHLTKFLSNCSLESKVFPCMKFILIREKEIKRFMLLATVFSFIFLYLVLRFHFHAFKLWKEFMFV